MPSGLLATDLVSPLRAFFDQDFEGFVAFPVDVVAAADAWVGAVDVYTFGGLGITPPSLTGAAAHAAFVGAFLASMAVPAAGVAALDAAFAAYAAALIPGMLPGFVGVVPPAPLSLTPPTIATIIAAGLAGASSATQAGVIATWIHTWFRTGTATPTSGPGITVLWV